MFGNLLTNYEKRGIIQSSEREAALSPLGPRKFCEDNLRDKKRSDFYGQIFFGRGI